jgi:hypothetical protein
MSEEFSPAQGPQTLDQVADQVVSILVDTFGFDQAEAQHRIDLWKADQHHLAGDVVKTLLPLMPPQERAEEMLRFVLRGQELIERLEERQRNSEG